MTTRTTSGPRWTVAATVAGGLVAFALTACTSSGDGSATSTPPDAQSQPASASGSASGSGPGAGAGGTSPAPSTGSAPGTSTVGAGSGATTHAGSPGSQTSTAPGSATGTPRSINGPGGAGSSGSPHGRPSGTAVQAFRAWTADWNGSRYHDMYSALPAAQQAQVRYQQFAQCQQDQVQQVGATSIVYQRTLNQHPAHMFGATGTQVTGQLYFDGFSPVTTQRTLFWYTEGAAWRWALEPSAVRTYRRGSCPS